MKMLRDTKKYNLKMLVETYTDMAVTLKAFKMATFLYDPYKSKLSEPGQLCSVSSCYKNQTGFV